MSLIRCSRNRRVNSLFVLNQQKFAARILAARSLSTINITKNIILLSNDAAKSLSQVKQDKPLCIMFGWLLAKPKYLRKYADMYLERNIDVLTVGLTPWQLLWPKTGSQIVATDVLNFIETNFTKSPLYLHGFSVGAYLWSESLYKIASEAEKYRPLTSRFVAQVWDSPADVHDTPLGVPKAVFPKNPIMENAMRKYIIYHMKTFDKVATCHYIRCSQTFHTNLIRCPALFMVSSKDTIGPVSSSARARDAWQAQGMEVYFKDWVDSLHVGHFRKHSKEYKELLNQFLDKACGAKNDSMQMQHSMKI